MARFVMAKENLKIIFMGSAEFSLPILMSLYKKFAVSAVVTEIDKPTGRDKEIQSPPVKILAQSVSLPVYQPISMRKDTLLIEKIKQMAPDLIVVAAYGKIIPESILNIPAHGCLNVHPSLLPKYRGASPIQSALLAGDTVTGVTIILMDAGMDTGDIVAQETCDIAPDMSYGELSERLTAQSAEMLLRVIPEYVAGKTRLKTQRDVDATYCKKINKTDGKIDWTRSAEQIYNQWRAFAAWPGVYTIFDGQKLDIIGGRAVNVQSAYQPGTVYAESKKIYVACGQGALELARVKLEGKKEMDIVSFVNGRKDFVGSILK